MNWSIPCRSIACAQYRKVPPAFSIPFCHRRVRRTAHRLIDRLTHFNPLNTLTGLSAELHYQNGAEQRGDGSLVDKVRPHDDIHLILHTDTYAHTHTHRLSIYGKALACSDSSDTKRSLAITHSSLHHSSPHVHPSLTQVTPSARWTCLASPGTSHRPPHRWPSH